MIYKLPLKKILRQDINSKKLPCLILFLRGDTLDCQISSSENSELKITLLLVNIIINTECQLRQHNVVGL